MAEKFDVTIVNELFPPTENTKLIDLQAKWQIMCLFLF